MFSPLKLAFIAKNPPKVFVELKPSISRITNFYAWRKSVNLFLHKTTLVGKFAPLSVDEFIAVVLVSCKHIWTMRRCTARCSYATTSL